MIRAAAEPNVLLGPTARGVPAYTSDCIAQQFSSQGFSVGNAFDKMPATADIQMTMNEITVIIGNLPYPIAKTEALVSTIMFAVI